ncbi:hypothetical protein CPB84DRAFT_1798234 [Gymnopilus junonius]|uniref:NAD(P)-binding protein n=1 Tax=Gymnopilus junonius TaxID=109634 RepID=A0A9P5TGW7_GYMJU|nr:hypothetical protein CPB84DRAFT_1798234 [Gymnopilus junonius]
MSSPTVYFVTGLALVAELIKKQNVYVFAAARHTSPTLKDLSIKHSDKVSIIPFVAADDSSNKAAAKIVGDKFGRVDVVLGVAGISNFMGTVEETPAEQMNEHYKINVTGILVLFQAFAPLLRKSNDPKFIPFTSGGASLTAFISIPAGYTCYGASKAAENYLARKIHFENPWITIENRAADKSGTLAPVQDAMAVTPEVAATSLVSVIDSATRDTHGGEFINVDGEKIPW